MSRNDWWVLWSFASLHSLSPSPLGTVDCGQKYPVKWRRWIYESAESFTDFLVKGFEFEKFHRSVPVIELSHLHANQGSKVTFQIPNEDGCVCTRDKIGGRSEGRKIVR